MVAVAESLQQALQYHEAGKLDQAEALYREIIRIDPGHVDALHLLGVAAHQKADHRTAADYIHQAIAKGGQSALYYSNLGACYRAMNRLADAIEAFREAVQLEPDFVGARYNLAMALETTGSIDEAISEYQQVLRIDPSFVRALNNLGSLMASHSRFDEAVRYFRSAITRQPNSAEFHYNLANALAKGDRCEEAIGEYRESIRLNPTIAETYNNLATALNTLGCHEEALTELDIALELRPDYTEARINRSTIEKILHSKEQGLEPPDSVNQLAPPVNVSAAQLCDKGSLLQAEGCFDEAAESFRRALELEPNCALAYFGLGYGLLVAEKHKEAETYFEQGLLIDDTNAPAWNNLGSIYSVLENWDEAIACYESALQIDPTNAKAHFNLGNVDKDLEQLAEAAACYRRALYVDPGLVEAHINLGVILQRQGRLEEAAAAHDRAVELRPHDAEAHFHRSLTWLLMGDLERGWREYEWRWRYDATPRNFSFPVWTGGDISQKSLLIYAEQGIGDELLFASCLPDAIERAGQCLIECDPRLVPLYARSFPHADVVGNPLSVKDAEAYGIDVQIAVGSLPGIFRNSFEEFPKRRRFLAACPQQRSVWSARYAQLGTGLKVGISWRGGSKASIRRQRSTVLEQWKPLFDVPGVNFINLQYGNCTAELEAVRDKLGVAIHHWDDANPLQNLDGFAAQIAELDLVISVDNSTVHMTGGLGVPVWTLLHFAPNWRWMLGRGDSPWYPTMSLLRQEEYGEWDAVFAAASEHLRLLTTCQASKTPSARHEMLLRTSPGTRPSNEHLVAARPAQSTDLQAAEERAKYERIWTFDDYRRYSPGAAAIDQIGLIDVLRKYGVRTILDAGCGTGKLMWRLMNEFGGEFDVHGFDITDNCLDACFSRIKDRVLTVGCLWNPDDFKKVYDAVICTDVMEHIPTERVPAVLENLRKSTGRLAYLSISVVPDAFGPKLIGEHLHLTVRKSNWWFTKLALAGFQIVSHAVATVGNGSEAQLHVFCTPS